MKIERPRSLKELVVAELRSRIIDNRIDLGAALSENTLAADLGLSKTPVREALQQLRLEGLVEVLPQRGSFVFRIGAQQVEQISELRAVLEPAACELAVARNHLTLLQRMREVMEEMQGAYDRDDTVSYHKLDGAYHQTFIDLCGNPFLSEAYNQIGFRTQALRSRLSRIADLNSRSVAEHRQMLDFVERQEVPQLQALLTAHIRQTRDSYLRVLEENDLFGGDRAS